MMEERYRLRMDKHNFVAKVASPWFTYKQVDQTDAKECSICWDECTSYIYCANSEEHIVCKDCSKNIIVNSKYVNPDASIDVYWKCPICRHDNELGSWQFLPSTEQHKAEEASAERIQEQAEEASAERIQEQAEEASTERILERILEQAEEASAERIQEQAEELEERYLNRQIHALRHAILPPSRQEHRMEQERRMDPYSALDTHNRLDRARDEARERRLELIDENAPSKFRWVLSLDWRRNIVNDFKAWIMYTSPNYVENRHNIPPAGDELIALKVQHNYQRDKRSPYAPWFNFLMRTTPP